MRSRREFLATLPALGAGELEIAIRERLPAYTLRGYAVRRLFFGYDGLPMDGKLDRLPDLAPASRFTPESDSYCTHVRRVVADVLHPMGFSAATVEMAL